MFQATHCSATNATRANVIPSPTKANIQWFLAGMWPLLAKPPVSYTHTKVQYYQRITNH